MQKMVAVETWLYCHHLLLEHLGNSLRDLGVLSIEINAWRRLAEQSNNLIAILYTGASEDRQIDLFNYLAGRRRKSCRIIFKKTGGPGGYRIEAPETVDFLVGKNLVVRFSRERDAWTIGKTGLYPLGTAKYQIVIDISAGIDCKLFPLDECRKSRGTALLMIYAFGKIVTQDCCREIAKGITRVSEVADDMPAESNPDGLDSERIAGSLNLGTAVEVSEEWTG